MTAMAAWAQSPVLSWGEVVYCNGPDEGDMRPRIALNAQQAPVVLWGDDVPMVNRVAVGDAEHGEHDSEQVADERGIEPDEAVAADERQRDHDRDTDKTPRESATIEMVR